MMVFISAPLMAQSEGSLIRVLNSNAEIIKELDQFNSHMAKSYVDCACLSLKKKGHQDSRCGTRSTSATFTETKINYEGQKIEQSHACEQIIEKLQTRIKKIAGPLRSHLSLIEAYQQREKSTVQLERPENSERLKGHIVSEKIRHRDFLEAEGVPLDPLNIEEQKEALKKHFESAEKIRQKFIESPGHVLLFSKLDPKAVLAYLKEGKPGNLEEEIARLRNSSALSGSSFFSLKGLEDLYRKFVENERRLFVEELKKEYRRDLDILPLLAYLKNAHPSEQELLSALLKVETNAKIRSKDSEALLELLRCETDETIKVDEYAILMDNQLARKYLPVVLKAQGMGEEEIEAAITKLESIRQQQLARKNKIDMGIVVGSLAICFLPYPGMKALTSSTRLLFRNFCLLGSSGSVNTYFLLNSRDKYQEKLHNYLSTPDGWNKLVKANDVLEAKSEYNLASLLIGLEFIPAYDILKLVRGMN